MKKNLNIEGEILNDITSRIIYSTDASAYKEIPEAVIIPANINDLKSIIKYASENKKTIIPRAAGTSLAGQVVGNGIVVDISKKFNKIIELNKEEKWIKVDPGVNLTYLNDYLKEFNLFFGPETSTANRCLMGGMAGNNSCGLHSLKYGSTRDHTLEIEAILDDGSEVTFKEIDSIEYNSKLNFKGREGDIYRLINDTISSETNREEITKQYPDRNIKRRNTGYALDIIADDYKKERVNLAKLICGSEGTLCFITAIKFSLVDLPPKYKGLLCIHLNSIEDALKANLIALEHKPSAIELMDNKILELTKGNKEQYKNRFFIEGDPGALLIVEFNAEKNEEIAKKADNLTQSLQNKKLGYHFPLIYNEDTKKVWNLRKAGLGVLSNMKGDSKPVSVIEDTAVVPEKLPEYIIDFNRILEKYKTECVYHAHIATGELHLRPILNLKNDADVQKFKEIAKEVAILVKKYNGSLSGEHGDGRLRGEFIPLMYGDKVYEMLKNVKAAFDPNNIFNRGKIIDTPKMNSFLRYDNNSKNNNYKSTYRFSSEGGYLPAVEKCNGSGDCLKRAEAGGTMCPSYMATRDEKDSTRGRANTLREYLNGNKNTSELKDKDVLKVMELCLSCKACKSECPSGVDVSKLKSEFLFQYYKKHSLPLKIRMIGNIDLINQLGSFVPTLSNFILRAKVFKPFLSALGVSIDRDLPLIKKKNIKAEAQKLNHKLKDKHKIGKVYLFNDEFSKYNEPDLGIKTIILLQKLGYIVEIPEHKSSGRALYSKGLLKRAKKLAEKNINKLSQIVSDKTPLIGIEPSAILSFRDEYPEIADETLFNKSKKLSKNCLLIEEFISQEIKKGNITSDSFNKDNKEVLLHGHCQQKAIASTKQTIEILSLPVNYTVKEIPSGCCGMAGSFGYEKEHYNISMQIGEMVLFPAVRQASDKTIISAPGTSCRHQIKDGTGRTALHPVEVLLKAIKD